MMRSLFSGVSGLKNHQTRMDVIGNNISNVNTTGFKSSRVTFADTLNQTMTGASAPNGTLGGTNPKQVGLGSAVSSIDLLFTDGSVQSTGKNTDLCLSGNGLFVVSNGSQTYYTRNGAFEFDAAGNYVMPGSGLLVQGWMAKDGVVSTNSEVTNIQVSSGKSMASKSTETVTYNNNLNSAVLTITSLEGGTNATTETRIYTKSSDGALTGTTSYPLRLTLVDGTNLTDTSGTYKVGDTYTQTLDTGSATASDVATIKLTLADGRTVDGITGTTYTVGNDYTYQTSNAGDSVTASSKYRVVVTTADGNVTNELTSGSYTVGSDYTWTKTGSGESIEANANNEVTVSLKNGGSITGTPGTAYTVGTMYTTTQDSVIVKDGDTTQEVTLHFTDGSSEVVTTAGSYSKNGTYNTKTIDSIEVKSEAVSVSAKSKITSLEARSEIKSLEKSSIISQIEQDYVKAATATTDKPMTIKMSDGSTITETSGSYTVGHSLPITTTVSAYDTLGNVHSIPVYFTLSNVYSGSDSTVPGNTWTVSVNTDGSGKSTLTDGTEIAMEDANLTFTTAGKYYSGSPETATMTLTNGSLGTQKITIDMSALTQFAGNSTVNGSANGNAAGTLESVSIDASGVITGTYTNGVKQAEAQVAVAQFTNASGLTKTGSSLYQESNNSGTPNVKTAADLGVKITASALEMSNVDIANEFADMIVTQRGFQSNSKIITVGDEMLETVINMKR